MSMRNLHSILFYLVLLSASFIFAQTPSKEKKDLVKNLRARLLEDGFSIELTWTPPEEDGEIIIGRSKERIDTPEKLYYADSLGRYPNKKGEALRSFKDINLKPGNYYYAIAMVSRIKKRDVELVAGENYTVEPIYIGLPVEVPKPIVSPNLPYAHDNQHSVSEITIKPYSDYNQIRWTPPVNAENSKPVYHVYRSEEPLSSLPLMQKAEKIIELLHPETFYVDRKIVHGKNYYYGVSVSINGQEYIPLVEGKSFARMYYQTDLVPQKTVFVESKSEVVPTKKEVPTVEVVPAKKETPTVEIVPTKKEERGLHVYDLNYEYKGEGIFLTWAGPKEAIDNFTTYTVYFSTTNPKDLEQAIRRGKVVKLGEVVHPELSFSIPKIDRKKISFVAVTLRQGNGKEYMELIENESFVRVDPEKEFLTKKEEKSIPEEKIPKEETSKTIPKKEEPKIENITVEEKVEEKEKPDSPIEFVEPKKKTKDNLEFERIMTDYYRKRKFHEARKLLEDYAKRQENLEEKAKALFYSALCYYYQGLYEKALKILLKEDLKKHYNTERVDFYINRCIEKQEKNE